MLCTLICSNKLISNRTIITPHAYYNSLLGAWLVYIRYTMQTSWYQRVRGGLTQVRGKVAMTSFTIQDMLKAGMHFGHQTRYWNPKMAPYIYGVRNKIHIIDLGKSQPLFCEALNFIGSVAAKKGKILFVGTKYSAQELVQEAAERCHMPYVNHRWLGGMLTNYKTIRQSIKRLKELESMLETGKFGRATKREILDLTRDRAKLNNALGGIKNMGGIPDTLFVIDVGHENIAVREANRLGIPVVGIVDSNNDPTAITYVVPGNDDSSRSIRFYTTAVADTILDACASTLDGVQEMAVDEFMEVAPNTSDSAPAISPSVPTQSIDSSDEEDVAAKK